MKIVLLGEYSGITTPPPPPAAPEHAECISADKRVHIFVGKSGVYLRRYFFKPGGPIKTEQSIQSFFQGFALINSYLVSPCWIEHLFFIIITPRLSNLVENFLFYE